MSMTGFASHERNTDNGVIQVELRSVNQRYLELHFKLADAFRTQESQAREMLKAKLGRGKVECRINLAKATAEEGFELDHSVLQHIAASVKTASEYFLESQAVNMLDVLQMPGVVTAQVLDADALAQDVVGVLEVAIEALIEARAREGASEQHQGRQQKLARSHHEHAPRDHLRTGEHQSYGGSHQ